MSNAPVHTTLRQISDINMTPLMDLTFILLITFIITFPLIEQGIPMDLPQADAEALSEENVRSISLTREGNLFLDDVPISKEELIRDMQILAAASPNTAVMVRADEGIEYGRVVEVLKILTDAKIARMALVTSPENQ